MRTIHLLPELNGFKHPSLDIVSYNLFCLALSISARTRGSQARFLYEISEQLRKLFIR